MLQRLTDRSVMSETSELTGPLVKALNETGGLALRMPVGTLRKGKHWIKMHEEGTADILFFPRSGDQVGIPFGGKLYWKIDFKQPIWIETKDPKGKTAKKRALAQADFKGRVEALGHRYIRATTIDEGLEALR